MEKDYVVISEKIINVLGHKVKIVRERFSIDYLNSNRFKSRCLRCCFYNENKLYTRTTNICDYIRCNGWSREDATHFELVE